MEDWLNFCTIEGVYTYLYRCIRKKYAHGYVYLYDNMSWRGQTPNNNPVSAPAATFCTPTFDYSNTWNTAPVYTAPTTVSSGSSTYSSGSSTSTSGSSSSSDRSCRVCYGLGKCRTCNGNRQYFDTFTSKYIKCPNCTNGLCTSCGGSGRK